MPEDAGAWTVLVMHVLIAIGSGFAFARLLRLLDDPGDDDWGEDEGGGGGGGGGGGRRRGPRGPWGGGLPLDRLDPWPRRLRDARSHRPAHALARRPEHPPVPSRPAQPVAPQRSGPGVSGWRRRARAR